MVNNSSPQCKWLVVDISTELRNGVVNIYRHRH